MRKRKRFIPHIYKHCIKESVPRLNWKASLLGMEYLISLANFILLRQVPKAKFLKVIIKYLSKLQDF